MSCRRASSSDRQLFPCLGECCFSPLAEEKPLDIQLQQTAEEAVGDFEKQCDRGTKKNSHGYKQSWNGFKLHFDVNNSGFPLSAVLTSASLHNGNTTILLMKLTSGEASYCYDLMDAAYDAKQTWHLSKELRHVPIIDRNPRRGKAIPMAPHEARRYNERSAVEQFNSKLKEEFGSRSVMVRCTEKVMLYLMYRVVSLLAYILFKRESY